MLNAFARLSVSAKASDEEVHRAWRRACLAAHPDKGGSLDGMQDLDLARSILLDPQQRAKHLQITWPCPRNSAVIIVHLRHNIALNGSSGVVEDWNGLRVVVRLKDHTRKPLKVENIQVCNMGD